MCLIMVTRHFTPKHLITSSAQLASTVVRRTDSIEGQEEGPALQPLPSPCHISKGFEPRLYRMLRKPDWKVFRNMTFCRFNPSLLHCADCEQNKLPLLWPESSSKPRRVC